MDITLFHGSGTVVKKPEIRIGQYTKDFGYGFYCTNLYSQAERWALRHGNHKDEHPTVNMYRYRPNRKLKIKRFSKMTNEWLDFIAMCRSSKDATPHNYDIVEGPMADDQVWNFVDDFLSGSISRKQFWALAKFKQPSHQITFHTEEALKCLTYEGVVTINAQNQT